MKELRIGKKRIGAGHPVFIIAEAGVNHNGKLALAKKLVDAAKAAGADAVKFQTFKAEEVVTAAGKMAAYQKRNTGKDESQFAMLKRLELSEQNHKAVAAYAKRRGIMFFSTPHGGFRSVDFLEKLNVPLYKIGSADLTNLPLLAYAGKTKKPIIISTGMGTIAETKEAVRAIQKTGNKNIVTLQCTTDYPVKLEEVNARALQTLAHAVNTLVGFSDHTKGSHAAIVAVSLGACVLEKHLTLDNSMEGPDHKASLNPKDFAAYVRDVRMTEILLGSGEKKIEKSARRYIPLVLKSVVAARPIKKGEKLSEQNVAIKRPAGGLPPKAFFTLVGKRARRDIAQDAFIKKSDVA